MFSDFSLKHPPRCFDVFADENSNIPAVQAAMPPDLGPATLEQAGLEPEDPITQLILHGDDMERPIGTANAKYPSRSEVVFRVSIDLIRRGVPQEIVAGILLNPAYKISASVREKSNPRKYAWRQVQSAQTTLESSWPDVFKNGKPKPSYHNALTGLRRLRVTFEHDAFKNRKRVGGHFLNEFQGDLTDDIAAMLRKLFLETFGFDPGKMHLHDALQVACLENTFHPIRDSLDGLFWDGTQRLSSWFHRYLGTENTPLNSAIGTLLLVAAVRRVRRPGCKFDYMVVFEGAQGTGKSTAVAILAGEGNFSDQNLMALDDKAQMEALEGVWFYEVAELDGMSRAETSKIKAFISRTEDRGRPAYARFKESWPRQCVLVGTTNESFYLKDTTGNRRFLPVKTGEIDLEALRHDRDQLFAEAAALEASGFSITLPKDLWDAASASQAERMQDDPWLDTLARVKGHVRDGVERVATEMLFDEGCLDIPPAQRQSFHPKRIATVMRELGWDGPKKVRVHQGNDPVRGYERPANRPDDPSI